MCDFGISGYLVDSVAKTIDAGCKRKPFELCWMTLNFVEIVRRKSWKLIYLAHIF